MHVMNFSSHSSTGFLTFYSHTNTFSTGNQTLFAINYKKGPGERQLQDKGLIISKLMFALICLY